LIADYAHPRLGINRRLPLIGVTFSIVAGGSRRSQTKSIGSQEFPLFNHRGNPRQLESVRDCRTGNGAHRWSRSPEQSLMRPANCV